MELVKQAMVLVVDKKKFVYNTINQIYFLSLKSLDDDFIIRSGVVLTKNDKHWQIEGIQLHSIPQEKISHELFYLNKIIDCKVGADCFKNVEIGDELLVIG